MSTLEQVQEAAEAAPQVQEVSLLDKIIADSRLARDEDQRELARDLIGEFVDQVVTGSMKVSKDTQAMVNARIGQIDALISRQLNEVMHHEDFQRLEASWRGLHYFVHQSETSTMLKIRVMNASKKDLFKDMERAEPPSGPPEKAPAQVGEKPPSDLEELRRAWQEFEERKGDWSKGR